MKPGLDRETIILALQRLSELLRERGVQGEICLFGGTAMVLAFNAHLGLASAEEALSIVSEYYPRSRLPARTQYLLEEIFEELGGQP